MAASSTSTLACRLVRAERVVRQEPVDRQARVARRAQAARPLELAERAPWAARRARVAQEQPVPVAHRVLAEAAQVVRAEPLVQVVPGPPLGRVVLAVQVVRARAALVEPAARAARPDVIALEWGLERSFRRVLESCCTLGLERATRARRCPCSFALPVSMTSPSST